MSFVGLGVSDHVAQSFLGAHQDQQFPCSGYSCIDEISAHEQWRPHEYRDDHYFELTHLTFMNGYSISQLQLIQVLRLKLHNLIFIKKNGNRGILCIDARDISDVSIENALPL